MARSKCFVQTVQVDVLRWETNPLAAEIKSGEFVIVGNITGIATADATATGPLTIRVENGILFHAELEGAKVNDSVFGKSDGELYIASSGGTAGDYLVGQVVEVINPSAAVVQKFAQGIEVI